MTNAEFIQMAAIIAKRGASWADDVAVRLIDQTAGASAQARPEVVARFKADVMDVFRVWDC